jgi:ABC-2 type transport system permease protein
MTTLRRIAHHEFLEIVRDGRFRACAAIVMTLLVMALAAGWTHHRDIAAQHARAQSQTREHWLKQPAKDPHSAAHYGIYAFKPRLPLALFDTGVDPFTGVVAWLEAHKQNEFQYRPAQDRGAIVRFGELTAATTLQFLVPILIVLLAAEAFAGEREQGTLRQLASIGVAPRTLAVGKLAGLAAALAVVLVPAAVIGGLALAAGADGETAVSLRACLLAAVYLAWFAVVACLALAVSARMRAVRPALAILVAFWALNAVVAPRLASELGRWLNPTPSAFTFAEEVQRETYDGLDIHEFNLRRSRELKTRLLREYGVTRVQDLPVNFRGVDYLEREAHSNRTFDRLYDQLWGAFTRQIEVQQRASLAAPLLAVRSLSMALAGTDFFHHRHFATAAEAYRRRLVETMNHDLAYNSTSGSLGYTAGPELWARLSPFEYHAPPLTWALRGQAWSVAALACWLLLAAAALWRAVTTLRID